MIEIVLIIGVVFGVLGVVAWRNQPRKLLWFPGTLTLGYRNRIGYGMDCGRDWGIGESFTTLRIDVETGEQLITEPTDERICEECDKPYKDYLCSDCGCCGWCCDSSQDCKTCGYCVRICICEDEE